jgi:hypothetical protein
MMVVVGGLGLLLGGAFEFVRLRRLSEVYRGRVINARRALGYARLSAGWSQERWLAECRDIDRMNRQWRPFQVGRPFSPEVARRHLAYWEPIRAKYEHAALYPWLPVEPDPPRP